MASKKKPKNLFSYLNAKDIKAMHGKPKLKKVFLQVREMNKEIIKERKAKSLIQPTHM